MHERVRLPWPATALYPAGLIPSWRAGFSTFLGFLKLSSGAIIAARLGSHVYSLFGGLLSAGLSVTTLGFMVSNPGVFVRSSAFRRSRSPPGSSCSRTSACSPSFFGSPSARRGALFTLHQPYTGTVAGLKVEKLRIAHGDKL